LGELVELTVPATHLPRRFAAGRKNTKTASVWAITKLESANSWSWRIFHLWY